MSARIQELLPQFYDRLAPSGLEIIDNSVNLAQAYQHRKIRSEHLAISTLRHPMIYNLMLPYSIDTHLSAEDLNNRLIFNRESPSRYHPARDFLGILTRSDQLLEDQTAIDAYSLLAANLLERGITGLSIYPNAATEAKTRRVSAVPVEPRKAGLTALELAQKERIGIYSVLDPQILILRAAGLSVETIAKQLGMSGPECQIRVIKLSQGGIITPSKESKYATVPPQDLPTKVNNLVASEYTDKEIAIVLNIRPSLVRSTVKHLVAQGEIKVRRVQSFNREVTLQKLASLRNHPDNFSLAEIAVMMGETYDRVRSLNKTLIEQGLVSE